MGKGRAGDPTLRYLRNYEAKRVEGREHEPVEKGWVTIKNEPNINSNIISSDKLNINVIEADKNEGDERNILLHIGILSPFNDDPVIIIKQKGI